MRSIFWFRRDLRINDNTGFYEALSAEEPVVPIFIFDTDILDQLKDRDDARVTFIHNTVSELNESLGGALRVYVGKPAEIFKGILEEESTKAVYTNHDYEPYAVDRDAQIKSMCSKAGIEFKTFKDQVIFEKLEVSKADGKPYTVYTPYKNKWREEFKKIKLKSFHSEKLLKNLAKHKKHQVLSLKRLGFEASSIDVPKADLTLRLLKSYAKMRNVPSVKGTSHVGVHLRFGTVSVRDCVRIAFKNSPTWLDELIWREFFMQILFNFPNVEKEAAKAKYSKIKWENDKKRFAKWCEGKTGFPIVDAGMRELNETGFMHNRVRMIAASFLVKNLLINWQWGEEYFARKLLDFELSSNNGNWQWVAGTGCDAAPYFRVFNPETQQKKFDPDFKYVRQWVPDYGTDAYPEPLVDLSETRERAIKAYAKSFAEVRA